jgi:hypothetical protein
MKTYFSTDCAVFINTQHDISYSYRVPQHLVLNELRQYLDNDDQMQALLILVESQDHWDTWDNDFFINQIKKGTAHSNFILIAQDILRMKDHGFPIA